jgi:hypothetical protein
LSAPHVNVSNRGVWKLPEVAQALGPVAEGVAGADVTALYGTRWVLAWRTSGELQLYRDLEPVAPLNPLPVPPRSARHISLAFDQGARPVIAWQDGAAVVVTQWDSNLGAFVQRGPFAGVDPCLVADPTVMYVISGSDVALFYLTPDRLSLKHRVQREFYAVERDAASLAGAGYLDQVAALPWKVQAFVGHDSGDSSVFSSALYPMSFKDHLAAALAGPTSGAIRDVLLIEDATGRIAAALSGPSSGAIRDASLTEGSSDVLAVALSGPSSGGLRDVLLIETGPSDGLHVSLSGPSSGALVTVLLIETPPSDALAAGISNPTGGTYE